MATYEEIYGKRVKEFDSDPTLDSSYEGQVWYDKATGVLKSVVTIEGWSSGGNLIAVNNGLAGAGIQTAALAFGSRTPGRDSSTEEYNGTGWTAGGDLGAPYGNLAGAGTQTAGLMFGGGPGGANSTTTKTYNGTSWTAANAMSVTNSLFAGTGTQTAALAAAGLNPPNSGRTTSEEFDGTNWTSGGTVGTARYSVGASGTSSSAAIFGGGAGGPHSALTEEYNGTAFSTGGALNNSRFAYNGGAGTSADQAWMIGGYDSDDMNEAEAYDGTSWSAKANLTTESRSGAAGGQTPSSSTIFFGGRDGSSDLSLTQEFTQSINTITAAAFSNGGNLNTARWGLGGCGTKAAGIAFGGRNPPVGQDLARSEQYDGSSWSEGPDLNTATRVCGKGTGTQTAALKHGGHYGSPSTRYKVAEEWDGSSWTNGGTSSNAHDGTQQIGTQTAAASCGGYDGAPMNETEEYNGTSFSTANTMTYSAYQGGASGPQTAAVVFAGGFPAVFNSSEYDGTNWTAGGTLPSLRGGYGTCGNTGNGSQTAAIGAGGYVPGPSYLNGSFTYDGTVFSTGPNIATARSELVSGGPNSSFYITGGLTPAGSASNATEEFTEESSTITASTLTSS